MSDNPFTPTPDEQFRVGVSDFSILNNVAVRLESGTLMMCRSGYATATIDQYTGYIKRNALVLLPPGPILLLTNISEDFRMVYCTFSRDLFAEAAYRLDPEFFKGIHDYPIAYLPAKAVVGATMWFQIADYTYRDRENMYRNTIIKNRLQNVLLEVYDKMQRYIFRKVRDEKSTTRQVDIFWRFVALVHEHCSREREVSFYADQLCISTRYLSTIVRVVTHDSAKEFIDRAVILEVKMLLQSTDLSIQEITYRLHFPDQSYLGRYFKKHTGQSPTDYRLSKR